ncbi:MAG: M15 family metallopeptidase [Chitinispirillales bacterium]|nr:M15 family metallopeptidase [Chitinispirillales bacterium]
MRGIDKLHPEVREMAEELQRMCRENGLPLLITETWRTKEEQDALYAKGRTAPGKVVTNCKYPYSAHCWGVAFDFCRNIRGREYETADGFFQKVGQLGKSIGLFWGGDFRSFKDMPHFEHPGYVVNNSIKTLAETWGTPEAFKKSWKTTIVQESESVKIEDEGARRIMPEALKKIMPSEQVSSTETLIGADSAWEWATKNGLTEGIAKNEMISGDALIKLLYKYNAAK